jgi:hypothetical protein
MIAAVYRVHDPWRTLTSRNWGAGVRQCHLQKGVAHRPPDGLQAQNLSPIAPLVRSDVRVIETASNHLGDSCLRVVQADIDPVDLGLWFGAILCNPVSLGADGLSARMFDDAERS